MLSVIKRYMSPIDKMTAYLISVLYRRDLRSLDGSINYFVEAILSENVSYDSESEDSEQ